MFGSGKNASAEASAINIIGNGTKISGDIVSNGDVRIDGSLKGNISISGRLVLGAGALIEGDIQAANAELMGEVKGKVNITETLSLKATAKIAGDIITSKLAIEPGALFTGNCNMGAVVKNLNNKGNEQSAATKTA
ncbi:MAG: polymer-forming cytoskeletal protein [Sediminibacterium sp.]|nr:polymer-forming cytoskeletal protein [Sediminibacterium sp.]